MIQEINKSMRGQRYRPSGLFGLGGTAPVGGGFCIGGIRRRGGPEGAPRDRDRDRERDDLGRFFCLSSANCLISSGVGTAVGGTGQPSTAPNVSKLSFGNTVGDSISGALSDIHESPDVLPERSRGLAIGPVEAGTTVGGFTRGGASDGAFILSCTTFSADERRMISEP